MATQKTTFSKKKSGPALGFRTADHFRAIKFGGKVTQPQTRFSATSFRTQHKGGS